MENSNNISIEDLGHMSFDTSETPVIDIYHAVNKALNFRGPIEIKQVETSDDDLKRLVLNPQKAELAFDMKFTYELDRWVKSCIDWYKQNEDFETRSHIRSITEKNLK